MSDDLNKHLDDYLRDAHSIEVQALRQMESAPDIAGDPAFAAALREHREETEEHERRVRELLEERGTSPSMVKDAVMGAGGKAFVLFAEMQTATPGKLAAHALSYEALEWASHDLLARTADRAGAARVAEVARSIRDEEGLMMERIEALFDGILTAALEDSESDDDLREDLRRTLADVHALETQSVQLLESGIKMVEGELKEVLRQHLSETETQREIVERRLDDLGSKSSALKDAALRIGALNWGAFFGVQPDTQSKLAAFAYAVEHLEIGGYELLRRLAGRAGDEATAAAASQILEGERRAASMIRDTFDDALDRTLASMGITG